MRRRGRLISFSGIDGSGKTTQVKLLENRLRENSLDLLVDGMSDLHDPPTKMRLGFKLLKLLPRPEEAFLIDVDAGSAYGRKPDLPSVSHNVQRIHLYLSMCEQSGVKVMDGRRPAETIHQDVWNLVSSMVTSR